MNPIDIKLSISPETWKKFVTFPLPTPKGYPIHAYPFRIYRFHPIRYISGQNSEGQIVAEIKGKREVKV